MQEAQTPLLIYLTGKGLQATLVQPHFMWHAIYVKELSPPFPMLCCLFCFFQKILVVKVKAGWAIQDLP